MVIVILIEEKVMTDNLQELGFGYIKYPEVPIQDDSPDTIKKLEAEVKFLKDKINILEGKLTAVTTNTPVITAVQKPSKDEFPEAGFADRMKKLDEIDGGKERLDLLNTESKSTKEANLPDDELYKVLYNRYRGPHNHAKLMGYSLLQLIEMQGANAVDLSRQYNLPMGENPYNKEVYPGRYTAWELGFRIRKAQ
jgi:hypothetical protein